MAILLRLPKLVGASRLSAMLSTITSALGRKQVGEVSMRWGHKLYLDRRSRTEQKAFYSGSYKDEAVDMLAQLTLPHTALVDVGAHVGLMTVPLTLATQHKGATVLAFEPIPANIERLLANLELNELPPDHIFPFALSSGPSEVIMTMREDYAAGALTPNASVQIEDGEDQHRKAYKVTAFTLDEVYAANPSLQPPSAIKLDVEGHEDQVLAGASNTIARHRPIIFAEVNNVYFRRKHTSYDAAIKAYRAAGYKILTHRRHLTYPSNLDALTKVQDVWMVPQERLAEFIETHRRYFRS